MYELMTDRARKVMALSNHEAQRFNHEYVGTEHILLGIAKEWSGTASKVLGAMDIDPRKIRLEVEKLLKSGPDLVTMGKLPQTVRAKKSIELAIEESKILNDRHVGTEHLLLGLIREGGGTAAIVLAGLGLTTEKIREKILDLVASWSQSGKTEKVDYGPAAPSRTVTLATEYLANVVEEDCGTKYGKTALLWNLIYVIQKHAKGK